MKTDIERMYRRIAKAERRISRKVRVEEETTRVKRLLGIIEGLKGGKD